MRSIFPPKDLEKYGAQNTHAPFFFFFNVKHIQWKIKFIIHSLYYYFITNKSIKG